MNIDSIVEELLLSIRPGRAGWKDRARARLRAEVAQRAQAWASASAEARQAEAEARKAAEPVWRVVPEMGTHSFAGQLYGYEVVPEGGHLTRAEAEAAAETLRQRDSERIQKARAFWAEYMR